MQCKRYKNISLYQFEKLPQDKLSHGVFPRYPEIQHAKKSWDFSDESWTSQLKTRDLYSFFSISEFVKVKQVHGIEVLDIHSPTCAKNNQKADALVTQEKGICLAIRHADCQAILIYDPVQECIANIHNGWKASVKNIIRHTLDFMKKTYQTKTQDLIACIGPSLGPKHAEFTHYRKEIPENLWSFQSKEKYFDFWAISQWQLEECGVLTKNIEIARLCTYENQDLFYSYRRDRTKKRHASFIALI